MTDQTFDQFSETLWVTAVQAATIWTSPSSPRPIDEAGINNPTDMDNWISSLSYEANVALSDENRIQTQTLYGEAVIITETDNDWAHVVVPSQASLKDERGYPGWVPLNQLQKVDQHAWQRAESAAVTASFARLETADGDKVMKLSYMTVLPVEEQAGTRVKVTTPHGPHFLQEQDVTIFPSDEGLPKYPGPKLLEAGEIFKGLSYFWGGMSSFGYDCSGFVYAMHQANGYQIPRDAGDQAQAGPPVSLDRLAPGDLIFFAYDAGKGALHHVGFYYGDEQMLHSPQTGRGIELIDLEGTTYEQELCAAVRFWQQAKEQVL